MKHLWSTLFILAATTTAHAQGIELTHQLRTNLSHATKYAWKPAPPQSGEKLATQRFHEQIDKDMKAKGWKLVTEGADITLSGVIIVTSIDEDDFATEKRPDAMGGDDIKTPDYQGERPNASTARILTIGAYDPTGKKLLWEAQVQIRLSKNFQNTLTTVEKCADELVKGFIPAGKPATP